MGSLLPWYLTGALSLLAGSVTVVNPMSAVAAVTLAGALFLSLTLGLAPIGVILGVDTGFRIPISRALSNRMNSRG